MLAYIEKNKVLCFFILSTVLLFSTLGLNSLWDQDEAAYAGFAKNMVEEHNWLIPHFTWSEVHRKPPLHFWNICISYLIFGINEFSVRFPSALFIFLSYILVYFGTSKIFGKSLSFMAALVLSTSILVPTLAKVSVTDATLFFFTTLCGVAIIHVLLYKNGWWLLAFWVSFALALLTKGPPIIIFVGVFVVVLFIFHPLRRNLWYLQPWFFAPLAFLPLLAWGYMAWQKDGGVFITWMLDWYILKRVSGSVFGQTGPPGTHLIGLMLFFIPYFMFFPKAISQAVKSIFKNKGEDFILAAWFVAAWFIFEFTPSKLPAYVIGAHVPLAFIIAKLILNFNTENLPNKAWVIQHFVLTGLLFGGLVVAPIVLHLSVQVMVMVGISGVMLLMGWGYAIKVYNTIKFPTVLLGLNLSFSVLVALVILPNIDGIKDSSKRVGQYLNTNVKPSATVVIANDHGRPPSLPFYVECSFKNVIYTKNQDSIAMLFSTQNNIALVLNNEQKEALLNKFPDVTYTTISALLLDRNQKANYYVFRK